MTKKRFHFGVDIPAKMEKYNRRFTDVKGFLDKHYEHQMLWDNQEGCWINLDEALESMEKEYSNIKKENGVLKSAEMEYEDALGILEEENKQLKEEFDELKRENRKLNESCGKFVIKIGRLEKENKDLRQMVDFYKDFQKDAREIGKRMKS